MKWRKFLSLWTWPLSISEGFGKSLYLLIFCMVLTYVASCWCYHLLISILHITKRICCSCFGSLVAKTWSQRRRRGVSSQQQTWVIGYLHINPHLLHFYSPFCFKAYSRFPFINFECRWTNLSRIHFTLLPRNWWPCNDFRYPLNYNNENFNNFL